MERAAANVTSVGKNRYWNKNIESPRARGDEAQGQKQLCWKVEHEQNPFRTQRAHSEERVLRASSGPHRAPRLRELQPRKLGASAAIGHSDGRPSSDNLNGGSVSLGTLGQGKKTVTMSHGDREHPENSLQRLANIIAGHSDAEVL
ncbi:hypothetical protein CB1_000204026 [Camelus ferus]|nr:hypothetical protein CB1_000204026 [Camelus ferus]